MDYRRNRLIRAQIQARMAWRRSRQFRTNFGRVEGGVTDRISNNRKKLVELRNGQKARVQNQRYFPKRRILGHKGSAIETHRPSLHERWKIILDRMQDRPIVAWER